jgi:hypothetical protein
MTREEIDLLLTGQNREAVTAHTEIVKLQRKESTILKTGIDHLDNFLIGGLSNKLIFKGSRPAMGKTTSAEKILTNLLNPEINPNQNISILKMNLEMGMQSLLLRDYKKALGRGMKDILDRPFTESEIPIIQKVVAKHNDSRIINFSKTVNGDDLRYLLKQFCSISEAKGLTEKVVIVDHLHIYPTKKEIDEVLFICNEAKMSDPHLAFIFFFQFGRSLEEVWRDTKDKKANPKTFLPNSSHIYNTDSLMQYGSIVMGQVIPQVVDMEEYASIYKDRNMHLSEHFLEDNPDNKTVRLKGRNRIYYNYIKIRDLDDIDEARIYCDILNPEYEDKSNSIYLQNKTSISLPPINFGEKTIKTERKLTPIASLPPIENIFDMDVAFPKDGNALF